MDFRVGKSNAGRAVTPSTGLAWTTIIRHRGDDSFSARVATLLPLVVDDRETHASLVSLAQETNPLLQQEGLIYLAGQLVNRDAMPTALRLLEAAAHIPGAPAEIAIREREALLGGGDSGIFLENQFRHLASEATSPGMILSMGLAGTAFSATRAFTATQLLGSPASWWARGRIAEGLAVSAGLLAEVPTFTAGTRLWRGIHGEVLDWSGNAIGRELLANGLTLFALKSTAAFGNSAVAAIRSNPRLSVTALSSVERFIPQAAMYAGIVTAHRLETEFGLRPANPSENIWLGSLATLLQFNVAGRLVPNFGSAELDARLRSVQARPPRFDFLQDLSLPHLQPALASIGRAPRAELPLPQGSMAMMMVGEPSGVSESGISREVRLGEDDTYLKNSELHDFWRQIAGTIEWHSSFAFQLEGPLLALPMAQSHARYAYTVLRRFQELFPDPRVADVLQATQRNLLIVHDALAAVPRAENETITQAHWMKIEHQLARVGNLWANFLITGNPVELNGPRKVSGIARELSLEYLSQFSGSSILAAGLDDSLELRDFYPKGSPDFSKWPRIYISSNPWDHDHDVGGENHRIILLGEAPAHRLKLTQHHDVQWYVRDMDRMFDMHGRLSDLDGRGEVNTRRVRILPQDRIRQKIPADYLEAYDTIKLSDLSGEGGPQLIESHLLSWLKPGGIAYLESRDPAVITSITDLILKHQLGEIIVATIHGPAYLPMVDLENGNMHSVQFRKTSGPE